MYLEIFLLVLQILHWYSSVIVPPQIYIIFTEMPSTPCAFLGFRVFIIEKMSSLLTWKGFIRPFVLYEKHCKALILLLLLLLIIIINWSAAWGEKVIEKICFFKKTWKQICLIKKTNEKYVHPVCFLGHRNGPNHCVC